MGSDNSAVKWFDRPGREPVELSEPSARWAELAHTWGEAITQAVRPLRVRVEHVGSTAVPALIAKPVVDLQLSVPDLDDENAYRPGLESLGLVLRTRAPGYRFFRPPAGRSRVVHVHVCAAGSQWERNHLLFRDHLRRHSDVAIAYAELKRELAATVGHDRLAYSEGKTEFILRELKAASAELSDPVVDL